VEFSLVMHVRLSNSARIGCGLVLAFAAQSAAQSPAQSDATVSHDLAVAFARSLAPGDSQSAVAFIDGRIPTDIEASVHLPSTARLTGTVAVGRTDYVMATTALTPDSILHAIAHEYGSGWRGLNATRVAIVGNSSVGGFRPAPAAFPSTFCHDSTQVVATARRTDAQTTSVRLRVSAGSAVCARLPSAIRSQPANAALPLPIVYDPPNAGVSIQCFANAGSASTQTTLLSSLDLAALMDHYGKQLEAEGWTATTTEAPMLRKFWSRRDSAGVTETAALVVSVSPFAPTCRDASLTISTPRTR
jgi:hypothetical protein